VEKGGRMKKKILSVVLFLIITFVANAVADTLKISEDAIQNNNALEVEKAIKNGADVNVRYDRGNTPLMFAAYSGSLEVAKLLITNGADINAKNLGGVTALLMATKMPIHKNSVEIVKLLLKNGADVSIKDNYGDTAMKNVVYCPHANCLQIVLLLKQYGAVEPEPIEPALDGIYHIAGATIKFFPPHGWKRFHEDSMVSIVFRPTDIKDANLYIVVSPAVGDFDFERLVEVDKKNSKSKTTRTLEENETTFLNSNAYITVRVDTVRVDKEIKKAKSILFCKDKKIFNIWFVAKTQDYDRLLPLIEKCLESLEIE